MDTLEELRYYCEEDDPVGALMLTGEWGCGKTYLLNNSLTNKLKETHIILRVSLFGMESIEDVRDEVKKCWLYAFVESKETMSGVADAVKKAGKGLKAVAEKGSELLPDSLKTIVNGVLSINAIDFVKIGSKMGEKKVILIFDDLERANISTSDLLGCINDYCENLHINTIVVANEEKIQSNESDKIEYNEIKEKIIQRTVRYLPDYSVVVSSVIDSMVCDGDIVSQGYKSFLENNKELITTFFSGSSLENMTLNELDILKSDSKSREERVVEQQRREELLRHRPHNIRSLKCAIQDFKRIYRLLDTKQIEKKERWLTTFLAYVLSFRAGLIPESERYGTILSDEKVPILYAGFYNDKYITAGIKQWIRRGMWNQDMLEEELDYIVDKETFICVFEKMWKVNIFTLDYKVELSEEGFQYLKELMIQFQNKCKAKNLYILEVHVNKFIESIDKLITKQKQKLKEIHDIEKEDSAEID